VLVAIVWPKIRRVLSGEKVVMSELLGSSFCNNPSSSSSSAAATGEGGTKARNHIILNKDDPLPRQLEADIIFMVEMLRGVTKAWYVF
jgi:hypothetical protein